MFVHCNTTIDEFLSHLRDEALRNNKSPQYIDAIDRLEGCVTIEAELEKCGDELFEMEKDKDDLYDELECLVKVIDENLDPEGSKAIENALKIANAALERHAKPMPSRRSPATMRKEGAST